MRKGLVTDAGTMATAAKVYDLLRSCEKILAEHAKRASQGLYGQGIWGAALEHDLVSARARLLSARDLVSGVTDLSKEQN